MATIEQLYKKVKSIGNVEDFIFDEIDKVVQENNETLTKMNTDQMLEGKTTKGTDITPSYLNDPYFKSKKAAQAYANWKNKITPNPKRGRYTPNLFINGYYHKSINVQSKDRYVEFYSNVALGQKIELKFKNVLGLDEKNKEILSKQIVRPRIYAGIIKKLL